MNPRSTLLSLLLGLCLTSNVAVAKDSWSGRKLSSVLAELRAAGLPLLYSNQIVSDALVINDEPDGVLQLDRLRAALKPFGLELRPLAPADEGYAIVRSTAITPEQSAPLSEAVASDVALEEVTVFASRYNLTRAQAPQDSIYLPHASLEKTAGIEQDVLRSLQYLPGASSNSLSTLTHVRGGYEDENLVRFDGVELYKPVHLKEFQGLFGLLDPDWVQSLNFYSGAYPVQFGNHNAAVLDIAPRSTDDAQYTLGTSFLYTRLLGTGSYDHQDGHWLAGYRRSNVAQVMRRTEKSIGEPEFEDLVLRNSYKLGNGELRIGALRLNDDLNLQTDQRDQHAQTHDHDAYLWLGWQQDLSNTLQYNLQVTHTQLSTARSAGLDLLNISNGNLRDQRDARLYTLDGAANWHATSELQWQAGVHLNHSKASYQYTSIANYLAPLNATFGKPNQIQQAYDHTFTEPDYAGYLNLNYRHQAWRAELGLRYDVFPYLNHGTQLSPRLNLQYALNPTSAVHFSAGNYVQAQALHMLDSSTATPSFYAPERMRQYIVGWTRTVSTDVQLRVEGYEKYGSRLRPRAENLLSFISLASELDIDRNTLVATHSRARGIEVSVTASTAQPIGWWLNYSWSRVDDQINGSYVRRSWDQPQAFTVGANWTYQRWLLAGTASWHTGWAYTPLQLTNNGTSASLGTRNSQRFSDFASLELRAQYTLPMHGTQLQLFLEVRNALDRSNECCRELSVDNSSGAPRISIDNEAALSLIPIAGFNLHF